jgi:16S rRNA (guanine527-N7)-methyltransferase
MDYMDQLFRTARELFDIHLTDHQLKQFTIYQRELLDWNSRFNLTSIRDADGIRSLHFLDSLSCSLAWKEKPPRRLIDVGTGAGFPGIPLKILYPAMHLTLVESVGKKANFCRHIVGIMELDQTLVLASRAEDVGHMLDHREKYDWAVARAVADLAVLAEYLLPLVSVGGAFLAQKGQAGPAEVHKAENAIKILGGALHQLIPITLPGVTDDRYLVVVDKIAATPFNYPRKPGVPAKKPL